MGGWKSSATLTTLRNDAAAFGLELPIVLAVDGHGKQSRIRCCAYQLARIFQ